MTSPTLSDGRGKEDGSARSQPSADAGPNSPRSPVEWSDEWRRHQQAVVRRELRREREFLLCNRRAALRKRVALAREFPLNTCGSSRHVAIIADNLSTFGLDWMLLEEPLHCAGSLYSTVAALWEARTLLGALAPSEHEFFDEKRIAELIEAARATGPASPQGNSGRTPNPLKPLTKEGR